MKPTNPQHASMVSHPVDTSRLPTRREKVIAAFDKSKKNTEKKKPISRETSARLEESKRDETEMSTSTPITTRTQRKEEDALGKTSPNQPFIDRLEKLSDEPSRVLLEMKTTFPTLKEELDIFYLLYCYVATHLEQFLSCYNRVHYFS